ncbi:MAG: tetraacyldisaccharide 4'-kinase [Bacteroidaceae bacterium]
MKETSCRKNKIVYWLLPLSWLYGMVVNLRNELFNSGFIKQRSYKVPTICIGNITVGGTGKTPHTEYLIRLLQKAFHVAVLSRGYKRKSKGFVLATPTTSVRQIGDEPYQMKLKYPGITVAVDANRCHGIERLLAPTPRPKVDVVLLDDAYQHRYVKAGINILLIDYHRMICNDCLLPAGRLREPVSAKERASIVIVTKCPPDTKPMDFRILRNTICLRPYQQLFFTTLQYGKAFALFGKNKLEPSQLKDKDVLLLTGIAQPEPLFLYIKQYAKSVSSLTFPDHHDFSARDTQRINATFAAMEPQTALLLTTEKDASRLQALKTLDPSVKQHLFVIPIEVAFLQHGQALFNKTITTYVRKNTRNSCVDQA